jgi:hypothetical protein
LRSKLWLIPAAVVFLILLPVFGQVANQPDLGGYGVWSLPKFMAVTPAGDAPFNAKGKQVFDERRWNQSAGDPATHCLPLGVPRIMYSSYSMEILQAPNRVVIVYEGSTPIFRSIPIGTKAGLKHPPDPNPTYMGDSYGWWEGNSLIVDVVGFNDRTWLNAYGHPHGEKLHVVEKYTRRDTLTLDYTATIDDPEYYTNPWTVTITATYRPNDRLKEVICQEQQ